MKRRIELAIETEKITLQGPVPAIGWCGECARYSMKITAEQASQLAGVSEMLIYRMVEGERLHHSETADGRLRICMASLSTIVWAENCDVLRPV